jgi:uncharacterized protein involved in exopolysaccharide biosynthesis
MNMEIRDYVSHLGWRLSVLVLLPLAAGGAAFGLLADTPRQYEAETVLTVPSSVAGGASSGSVAQYMANLEQAIVSEPVVAMVADEVGVDASEFRDGLDTTQLGSSNLVRVTYQGPDPNDAARIVDVATRSAFDMVAQIQLSYGQSLDVLNSRVRTTTLDLEAAETQMENFLLDSGLVLPREQYLIIASDVARLEAEILQADIGGGPSATLVAALRDRRRELEELGALLPEYERLRAAVERAEDDLDTAQDELRLAENQLAHLKPQITDINTTPIPPIQTIGRGVGVAAAGGFIMAIALMVMLPSKRRRRPTTVRTAVGFPSPP